MSPLKLLSRNFNNLPLTIDDTPNVILDRLWVKKVLKTEYKVLINEDEEALPLAEHPLLRGCDVLGRTPG
jgi:hypothetical protein